MGGRCALAGRPAFIHHSAQVKRCGWVTSLAVAALLLMPVTAFAANGSISTAISAGTANDSANSVAIQGDGKIVSAGWTTDGTNIPTVVRYNTDGTLDTVF